MRKMFYEKTFQYAQWITPVLVTRVEIDEILANFFASPS